MAEPRQLHQVREILLLRFFSHVLLGAIE
jgi:hypothetical protein